MDYLYSSTLPAVRRLPDDLNAAGIASITDLSASYPIAVWYDFIYNRWRNNPFNASYLIMRLNAFGGVHESAPELPTLYRGTLPDLMGLLGVKFQGNRLLLYFGKYQPTIVFHG
jgi:hypothetical protein